MKYKTALAALLITLPLVSMGQVSFESFPACGVNVGFSGPAEIVSKAKLGPMTTPEFGLTGEAKMHQEVVAVKFIQEYAFCLCPSEPTAAQLRGEANKTSKFNFNIPGIGMSSVMPVDDIGGGVLKISRFVNPVSKPGCFLLQQVMTNKDEASVKELAKTYFDRLTRTDSQLGQSTEALAGKLLTAKELFNKGLLTEPQYNDRVKQLLAE